MSAVANAPAGLPIFIQEAGYPSDVSCGSSAALQATFIDELFTAWDSNADRISFINVVRLNDLSHADALFAASAYGGAPPAAFVAYLESLGLQQFDGGLKPALKELQLQTAARGW